MRAAGIAPASTVWKTVVLLLNDTRRGAPEGLASGAVVESARVELASPGCKPGVLPLNYDPAGREGIEPSRLSFGGSAVAMTRPKSGNKGRKELIAPKVGNAPRVLAWSGRLDSNRCTPHCICRAPRTGVEPVSLHGQWSCDAGRITRQFWRPRQGSNLHSLGLEDRCLIHSATGTWGDVRESNPSSPGHGRPSSPDE